MKPGRELDALIAEKVMGWTGIFQRSAQKAMGRPPGWTKMPLVNLPHYSTDIAAAWEVVDKLIQDGWLVKTVSSEIGGTDVLLECAVGARGRFSSDTMDGLHTSVPHATCLAALKAVE